MMRAIFVPAALGLVLLNLSDNSIAADSARYQLRYKFRPGEVIRTEVVHRVTVQTAIQGTSQTTETRSSSVKAWKVLDVADSGLIKFEHSVESIDMWQKMQGQQEVRYNSQTDETAPPGYEDAAKAVGVPLTIITMDSRGKIHDREEKYLQSNSNPAQMTILLPEEAVEVGHQWSIPLEVEVLKQATRAIVKIQTRQLLTLESVSDRVATIQVESQVLTPVDDPQIEAQLIQRLSNGKVRFDIEAGRVIEQQMDLDRRVLGFSGPASTMHYVTRFTETLLPASEHTAQKNKPTNRPEEAAIQSATRQSARPKTGFNPRSSQKRSGSIKK